jgi:hypothetical protein
LVTPEKRNESLSNLGKGTIILQKNQNKKSKQKSKYLFAIMQA